MAFCYLVHAQPALNVVIDADTGNEVDDPYALARALIESSWNIIGLNATQWQASHWTEPRSMENSHRLNQVILGHLGLKIKTRRGGAARMYDWGDQAQHSAAAYEIINQARVIPEGNKLTVIALGALTNVASALYIAPDIEDKIELHWLGTTYNFESGVLRKNDFNCMMDMQALDFLLFSNIEMHITPVNVASAMVFSYEETREQLSAQIPFYEFLIDRRKNHLDGGRKNRVLWDLAVISGVINPQWVSEVEITTSRDNGGRSIHYIKDLDSEKMKEEFFQKLKAYFDDM